jgi:hypothetical protein
MMKLDTVHLVSEDESFTCPVCWCIAKEPVECDTCSKMFCGSCVSDLENFPSCKAGGIKDFKGLGQNLYFLSRMNALEFKC